MNKYIKGLLKNLRNPAVSILTQIDHFSVVDKEAKVYERAKIFRSSVGAYTYIGRNTSLINAHVGKFCSIAGGVAIGMGTHTLNNASTSPIFTEKTNGLKKSWCKDSQEEVDPYPPVVLGNDVWIGARVMIMGGVTIGDGAVIGAGAIVTKDVPPYAVAVGVPAKVVKYRFANDVIEEFLRIKWWDLPEDLLQENLELFQSSNIDMAKMRELRAIMCRGGK